MRFIFLILAVIGLCGIRPAAAQRASTLPIVSDKSQERIALANKPEVPASRPLQMACAPLGGQVFEPNGQPLAGATLLIKGTSQVYVANSDGQFQLSETVYQGQTLTVQAAGYVTQDIPLNNCVLPRLVLVRAAGARIKRSGKRAGQVTRLDNRSTNLR